MNDHVDPVELSPTRAELIARVRSRGRQIRARRRLSVAGITAVVVVAIAAPAIAIGTRSSSTRQVPAVTTAAAKGDFRIAEVVGVSQPPCATPQLAAPVDRTCLTLGATVVDAGRIANVSAVRLENVWSVRVALFSDAGGDLQRRVTDKGYAVVVGGRIVDTVGPGGSNYSVVNVGRNLTRTAAIALATLIWGRPPRIVQPALSSFLELPGTEFPAGQDVGGTLVVDNNTGKRVTLPHDKNGCWIQWGVDVTNAQMPADIIFTQPCINKSTVLEPGVNRFPFTLSTDYNGCTSVPNPPPGAIGCRPPPHIVPPLPAGTYDVVLVPATGLFPTPPPLTITLVGTPTTPSPLGALSLQTGARSTKLLVPKGWQLKTEDGGGSGSASIWTNPDDPKEQISGVTGVEIGSWWETDGVKGSINPHLAAPGTQVQRVNYTTFLFHSDPPNGYPIDGVWIALVTASGPNAFVSASVQLPSAFHATATSILNRFISDTNAMVPPLSGPPKP